MSPSRSAAAGARGGDGGGGRAAITALLVVAIVVGMFLIIRARPGLDPFDPRSSAGDGANAAVLLLEDYGADVSITSRPPEPGADERVLVIVDRLNDDQRRDLLDFVEEGGVAVVADPDSTLHGGPSTAGGSVAIEGFLDPTQDAAPADAEANVERGDCTIASLDDLRGIYTPAGILFPAVPDEDHCFTEDGHSFVIVRRYGRGLVVGFGDNRVVTNRYLRLADNAGLITALLAPRDRTHVRVMLGTEAKPTPQDIGTGDEGLLDLVRPGIWMGLSQLALAFVVLCVARGIRPGRAVREPLPTSIAGNELVVATGNLMQRAHHHERAGWLLRGELYRQLVAHYRVPPDISIDALSDVAGRRSGVDPAEVRAVLNASVATAEQLVALTAHIDQLRARLLATTPERV